MLLCLQDGAEETYDRFQSLLQQRTLYPDTQGYLGALVEVGHKHSLHLAIELLTVNQCIELEVVFKAAEIKIGRTGRDKLVIDNDHLGMQDGGLVEVDLDARHEALLDIGASR